MQVVAFIPVRGGSRGIPGKNLKSLCGHPLLYWTCKAASECDFLDAVYVATEDALIAETVRSFELPKVEAIGRSAETTTDTASTESVLLEFASSHEFSHVFLIQATSPLLSSKDLAEAWKCIQTGTLDSILSVVRQHRFVWKTDEDGIATPQNYDPVQRPRRQDFEGMLVENGAFYVSSRTGLLESGVRLNGRIGVVEMPPESYTELDSPEDWAIVEHFLRMRLRGVDSTLAERISKLHFIGTDVDGCLTDSGMYYSERGDELKKFNTRDGMAFLMLKKAGFLTGIITGENTKMVERRGAKLKLDEVHQGASHKVSVMERILESRGLTWEQVAFLGDDLGDVELLKRVGVSACPNDAVTEVRDAAQLHLETHGGAGVFREFAELILSNGSR